MGQFSRFQLKCMSLCSLIEWCSWDDDGEDDDDDNNDRRVVWDVRNHNFWLYMCDTWL